MCICIIGDPSDLACVYLSWHARRRGIDVVELDEETLGQDWTFAFDDSEPGSGWILRSGTRHLLEELDGAFVRFNPKPSLPRNLKLAPAQEFAFVSERRCALQYFTDHLNMPVANRPSAGRANGSKPHQMALLEQAGFEIPRWMVTNDLDVALGFQAECSNGLIYKACSGLRSRVRFFDAQLEQRLSNGTTPVVMQEYIPGKDVRVHTVGSTAFATQVESSGGVDYRFESQGAEYTATWAPEEIEQLCVQVARREGLLIGGFDFRVTPEDEWFCLEVNPAPSFLPYEMATGQPIARELLCLLAPRRNNSAKFLQRGAGVRTAYFHNWAPSGSLTTVDK
jgi:glutathione synthase/RimK-type ligase-like ATP-grasp enzyme